MTLAHSMTQRVQGETKTFEVWSGVMKRKRHRSSRVIARELKKQKVVDVSHMTVQRTMHRRGTPSNSAKNLETVKKHGRLDWSNVVFSDEHKFEQFKKRQPTV